MLIKDIIKAQECCYRLNGDNNCTYCKECPLSETDENLNCQILLAEYTVEKIKEMDKLLEGQNYRLYELIQEENKYLTQQLEKIKEILNEAVL